MLLVLPASEVKREGGVVSRQQCRCVGRDSSEKNRIILQGTTVGQAGTGLHFKSTEIPLVDQEALTFIFFQIINVTHE